MHSLIRSGLIALLGLSTAACQKPPVPEDASDAEKRAAIETLYAGYREDFPGVAELFPAEAAALQDKGDAVLVDVRTAEEQAVSRLPGAITAAAFEAQLEAYRGKAVITYCTIGARSGAYARDLVAGGWDARNLRGSILAWTHAGLPLETPDGEPTRRLHVYGPTWNLAADGYEAVW